jgi:phage gp36-like protein
MRLTTPAGQNMAEIVQPPITLALATASAQIDTYLRKRYATPLALNGAAPVELVEACCVLARFSLAHGEGRTPTDQMTSARAETIGWLKMAALGQVVLDGALPSGEESYAQSSDRTPTFGGPNDIGSSPLGELVCSPFWDSAW